MKHKQQISEFAITPNELGQQMPALNQAADQSMNTSIGDAEHDDEGAMLKADLFKLAKYSFKLFKKIEDSDQYEAWVQAKVTKAADYIASVYHYLEYEMKFSEYGSKLENSDVYSESQRRAMRNVLLEARAKMKELKQVQLEKIERHKQKQLDESFMEVCGACGGAGHVEKQIPEATKEKVEKYNRQSKAFRAAAKRLDKNENGIPDYLETDQEMDVEKSKSTPPKPSKEKSSDSEDKPKKSAPKKDSESSSDKPAAPKKDSESSSDKPKKSPPKKDSESSSDESKSDSSSDKPKKSAPKKDSESSSDKPKKESTHDFGGSIYSESSKKEAAAAMWKNIKDSVAYLEEKKLATQDYDGDGKKETEEDEHAGVVDNAIKNSKKKDTNEESECMNESVELLRLRQLTERVIR